MCCGAVSYSNWAMDTKQEVGDRHAIRSLMVTGDGGTAD
jgi:hypothetical protein